MLGPMPPGLRKNLIPNLKYVTIPSPVIPQQLIPCHFIELIPPRINFAHDLYIFIVCLSQIECEFYENGDVICIFSANTYRA